MGILSNGTGSGRRMRTDFLLVLVAVFATRCTPVVREYRNLKSKDYEGFTATRTQPVYRGDSLRNIRFPAGGIGAGSLLTGGRGNLLGIVSPALVADLSRSVFILRASDVKGPASLNEAKFPPAIKILEGKLFPDQAGPGIQSIPYPGISRFSTCSFQAGFPFGRWELADRHVPVRAGLEIFSPFVPLDRHNSSFPAAVLHWRISNPLDRPVDLSIVFLVRDPFLCGLTGGGEEVPGGAGPTRMKAIDAGDLRGIGISAGGKKGRGPFRRLAILSVSPAEVDLSPGDSILQQGTAGALGIPAGEGISASISLNRRLDAGQEWVIPFLVSWSQDKDPSDVALEIVRNREFIYRSGRDFEKALFGSSYPGYVTEAVGASLASAEAAGPEEGNPEGGQSLMRFPGRDAWLFPGTDGVADPGTRASGALSILRLYQSWSYTGSLDRAQMERALGTFRDREEEARKDTAAPDPASLSLRLAAWKALGLMAADRRVAAAAENTGIRDLKGKSVAEADFLAGLLMRRCWNGEFFSGPEVESCRTDQLQGQCLAFILGLDTLLPGEKIRKSLKSVYRYNDRMNGGDMASTGVYPLLDGEEGLVNCTRPYGQDPAALRADAGDVLPASEYAVAIAMIGAGMTEEALKIIENSRKRYRGYNRNPFSPFPADSSGMADGWDLHLALSGYGYLDEGRIMCFDPAVSREDFNCIWVNPRAWGTIRLTGNSLDLDVLGGILQLGEIRLPDAYPFSRVERNPGFPVDIKRENHTLRIELEGMPGMGSGDRLEMKFIR